MLWQVALIVGRVKLEPQSKLTKVVQAGNGFGSLFGFPQGREKHASKDGDDGDDNQQFNKSKTATLVQCISHVALTNNETQSQLQVLC